MKLRIVNIFVIAIATLALAQPQRDGEIAGCISDPTGQPTPGATIVAKGAGARRTTEADAAGCYRLKALPPGSYRVTTRLPAFDNVTRENVRVEAAVVARLDFTIRLSPMCECLLVGDRSLPDQWNRADAVLHARLSDPDPGEPTRSGVYRHVASVLDDLKPLAAGRSRAGRLFVLQNQRSGAPEPYDVGQELVVFVMSERSDTFYITNDDPGWPDGRGSDTRAMAFLVQDGRIQHAPADFSSYVGRPIAVLLEELRALSRRGL
jgi:hypothetical protein